MKRVIWPWVLATTLGVLSLVLLPPTTVVAGGCPITIKASNTSSSYLHIDRTKSKVRVKSGTWAKLAHRCDVGLYYPLEPNQSNWSTACSMSQGCGKKRQYKLRVCSGPSENSAKSSNNCSWKHYGWTKAKTINLGDLGRLFSARPVLWRDDGRPADDPSPGQRPAPEERSKSTHAVTYETAPGCKEAVS